MARGTADAGDPGLAPHHVNITYIFSIKVLYIRATMCLSVTLLCVDFMDFMDFMDVPCSAPSLWLESEGLRRLTLACMLLLTTTLAALG